MKNIIISILLSLSLIGSGFIIKNQKASIHDLETRIEEIQANQIIQQAHFERELERQSRLKEIENHIGESNEKAKSDTSDAGSVFSASRLRRIEEIR